jgi:hypothetical protein
MELDGLDFTHKPGVAGAGVEQLVESAAGQRRYTIQEAVQEVRVTKINETAGEDVVDPIAARAAAKIAADEVHKMSPDEWQVAKAQYWQGRFDDLAARRFGGTAGN